MKVVSMENCSAPSELRDGSTCGDNAEGKAASLVKVLAGDCQRGCVDQTTAQAYRRLREITKTGRRMNYNSSDKSGKTFHFF